VLPEVERIRKLALGIAVVLLCVTTAAAEPGAEAAFGRGREMLKVGKYAEACDAFEESQRLRPQADTQFNIALCSEQLGKLATALALHRELAQTLDTPARRAKSAELAAQLEPRVPRLQLKIGEARKRTRRPPPGLEVRVNGVEITNFDDLPIDLGMNPITAIAPGFLDWSGQVSAAEEAKVVTIEIDLERDPDAKVGVGPVDPDPPGGGEEPVERPRTSSSNRKAYAGITIAMGGVALGGGLMFGYLAQSAWKDALLACGDDSECDDAQFARADDLQQKAKSRGTLATVLSVAGGVAVVVGVALYVTAPSSKKRVAIAPTAGAESAGVVVFGRF
jgi:tetratricopeptide (TPR) repeat protein